MHKYQQGYINPSLRRKKIGDASLTTKVAPEDKERVAELCQMLGTTPSSWVRDLVTNELQKFNSEPLSNTNRVDQKFTSSITYPVKKSGFIEKLKAFVDFLETQKKHEITAHALDAQYHKGH